jgi:hypothetical protein
MTYAIQSPIVGAPAVNVAYVPDTVQRWQVGDVFPASDPFWGGGEFMYVKNNSGSAIATGVMVVWDQLNNITPVANSANQARSVGVAYSNFPAAASWGWVQVSGLTPVSATASVAANTPVGITAAGQIGATSAGKEIENCISQLPSATTVVIAGGNTTNGSAVVLMPKTDGWFIGMALSGTGIPGGTTLTAIAPDSRTVTMSANATATGTISVTGTYTGFNGCVISRPFAQGRIT